MDFSNHLKMAIRAIAYCPQGRNRASFRSTIDGCKDNGNRSFGCGGHLGFFGTSQNGQNGILGNCLLLRSTVSKIMAIEVSTLVAILNFSKYLKMAKMAFWAIGYCPQGRNRAPFRSTIDGCRDNSNRSFGRDGHLGFFGTSQNSQNGILGNCLLPLGSKSSSVSLYDRRFPR